MAAPSPVASGNVTPASLGVEETLVAFPAAGAYELHVNDSNRVSGETLDIRLKEAILEADTPESLAAGTYTGTPADPKIKVIGPVACPRGVTATIKQTAGTLRAYKWSLVRVG